MIRVRRGARGTAVTRWVGGRALRGVSIITASTGLSQAIQLLAMLFIARLYTESELGVFAAVLGGATLLSLVATLQLQSAIPLVDRDGEARSVVWVGHYVALCVCSLAAAAVLAALVMGGLRLSSPVSLSFLLVPPLAMAISSFTLLRALQARIRNYRTIGSSTLAQSAVTSVTQVSAGVAGAGAIGLTTGALLGRLVNAAWLVRGAGLRSPAPVVAIPTTLRRWRHLAIWVLPTTLLNSAVLLGSATLVIALFGAAFAGAWALALRVLAVPAGLFGQAIATVVHPLLARRHRESVDLADPVGRIMGALLAVGAPFFALVFLFGESVFVAAFGANWGEAGRIASLLSPWLLVSLVVSPLSSFPLILSGARQLGVISATDSVARVSGLAIGALAGDALLGALLYSAAGFSFSIVLAVYVLRLAGSSLVQWLRRQAAVVGILVAGGIASKALILAEVSSGYFLGMTTVALLALLATVQLRRLLPS